MNNTVITSQMIADLPLAHQDSSYVPTFKRLLPRGSKITKEFLETQCVYISLLCLSDLLTHSAKQEFDTWMEIEQHDLCAVIEHEEIKYHQAVSELAYSFLNNGSRINTPKYSQKRAELGRQSTAANKELKSLHNDYMRKHFYNLVPKVEPCEI